MKRFKITEYKKLEKVNLYTVHFKGDEKNETDKFIDTFINHPKYQKDLQTIIYWIYKRIGKEGALERFFRPEKNAKALPIQPANPKLRLYCVRISDKILILGNGGVKTSKKVKDCPNCFPHFKNMNDIYFILNNSREKEETFVEDYKIIGKLKFYLKD